jgi:hypothetical protein
MLAARLPAFLDVGESPPGAEDLPDVNLGPAGGTVTVEGGGAVGSPVAQHALVRQGGRPAPCRNGQEGVGLHGTCTGRGALARQPGQRRLVAARRLCDRNQENGEKERRDWPFHCTVDSI